MNILVDKVLEFVIVDPLGIECDGHPRSTYNLEYS